MTRDALCGRAQSLRIEYVLQHGHAQHQIELFVKIEGRRILNQETAALSKSSACRSAPGFADHGGAQIHTGDLRAAIRKGYIALLVELGDRKIISLAQHKTNRDYLRSVREIESLHGNMVKLTSSFEQHWYGLAQAREDDWLAFRARYREALRG